MPNVTVKTHVDEFMRSDDTSEALNVLGGLPESEFVGLSSSFLTETEFGQISGNILTGTLQGTYADDYAAYMDDVPEGSFYTNLSGEVIQRQRLIFDDVAFLGDSQTAFLGTLSRFIRQIYIDWVRLSLGSQFRMVYDVIGNSPTFATGGQKINQFATNVSKVTASSARFVMVLGGTNNGLDLVDPIASANDMLSVVCQPIINSGKIPIVVAVYPAPSGVPGNSAWAVSDNLSAQRAAVQSICEANGILHYDYNSLIENGTPGRGINQAFEEDTNPHLSTFGASILGRALANRIREDFRLAHDPNEYATYDTVNSSFSANSFGRPDGYVAFFSGVTKSSESIVTTVSANSARWWRFHLTNPTGGHYGLIYNTTAMVEPASGKIVDCVIKARVLSGRFLPSIFQIVNQSSTEIASDFYGSGNRLGYIEPSDGEVLFRTPIIRVGNTDTAATPSMYFSISGDTVVDFSLFGVRKYPEYAALAAIGGLPKTEFAGISSTFATTANANTFPFKRSGCVAAWHISNVSVSANKVVQWNDITGNGKHLVQNNHSLRANWYDNYAEIRGNYSVSNGGVSGLNYRNMTIIWLGHQHLTTNTVADSYGFAGYIFKMAANGPGILASPYASLESGQGGSGTYVNGLTFKPGQSISYYSASYASTSATYGNNGSFVPNLSANAGSGTLNYMFSDHTGVNGMTWPTVGVLVFNRTLTNAEIKEITSYYGCDNSLGGAVVYVVGSSTVAGYGATTYANSCIPQFSDNIGADLAVYGLGGALYSTQVTGPSASYQPQKGRDGIHILMPMTNDLAANVPLSTMQMALTTQCSKIKGGDPYANFIGVTIPPRNANFSNGQTYVGFNSSRAVFNQWMRDNRDLFGGIYPATIADIAANVNIGQDGDESGPYYYGDNVHFNNAGHIEVAKELKKACKKLGQPEIIDDAITSLDIVNSVLRIIKAGDTYVIPASAVITPVIPPIMPLYLNFTTASTYGSDVGPTQDPNGVWNNLNGDVSSNIIPGPIYSLFDRTSTRTSIYLSILSATNPPGFGGVNNNGSSSIVGIPISASNSFWIVQSGVTLSLLMSGLSANIPYRFNCGGFRGSGDIRSTMLTFKGATSSVLIYNAGQMTALTAISGVIPDANGKLVINLDSIHPNGTGFGYLGVMIIDTPTLST